MSTRAFLVAEPPALLNTAAYVLPLLPFLLSSPLRAIITRGPTIRHLEGPLALYSCIQGQPLTLRLEAPPGSPGADVSVVEATLSAFQHSHGS